MTATTLPTSPSPTVGSDKATITQNTHRLELWLVAAAFLVVNLASFFWQQPLTFNNSKGWDGEHYYAMAQQFVDGEPLAAHAPFVFRVATPYLVALFFPNNLLLGFTVVNIIANLISTLLFVYWLRLHLSDWRVRLLLLLLFLTQWLGPIRFVYFNALYIDYWAFASWLAGLIVIDKIGQTGNKRWQRLAWVLLLSLLIALSVTIRESSLLLAVSLLFVQNPLVIDANFFGRLVTLRWHQLLRWIPPVFFLPLLVGVAVEVLIRQQATATNHYSFLGTAVHFAYAKTLLTYLHSWFVAFGPILILPLYNWRQLGNYLYQHQSFAIYLLATTLLAWIGGSDTERILHWSLPIVYLLVGKTIEQQRVLFATPLLVGVLAVSQALSHRLFWIIPDYPNDSRSPLPIFSLLSNACQYFDLWPDSALQNIRALSVAQYLALSTLLIWWIGYRDVRRKENAK